MEVVAGSRDCPGEALLGLVEFVTWVAIEVGCRLSRRADSDSICACRAARGKLLWETVCRRVGVEEKGSGINWCWAGVWRWGCGCG
jgi:hypothetical protein